MLEVKIIGAVDIGGTKIAVGAVTEDGQLINRAECATAPEDGFAAAVERIKSMLIDFAARARADYQGIGIACPGPLDPFTGIVGDVGTLPGWQGGNLMKQLETAFAVPVAVENDADAAALAEAGQGTAKGLKCIIYITVSTGIGGGIVLSGDLYRGVDGAHPELGHQVIDSSGPLCYCKARGCWESLASGPAMVSWLRERRQGVAEFTAADVCELARQGDQLACQAVEREGYYLGLGLANLITLFCPDSLVLGGGMMKSHDLFLGRALKEIQAVCTQVPAAKTQVALASLGLDTGLLGAAQAWIRRYRNVL
jgi:glucokinase